MSTKPDLEIRFERGLFASRWLMAPMYLGLAIALAMLTVVFLRGAVRQTLKRLRQSRRKPLSGMIFREVAFVQTSPVPG